ncbi:uncharacterized protein LOC116206947 [Punica granatum]|uniref:Uncharacterized protein n=2 Tax=Punica granatum TaxID=22663 RepID=A0A218W3G2_PUNGR|nr:uncharacterized protein LOC116206947 [Punica granatum]OWM67069.1 hypothetical protein CDL15_Pgr000521 [Punica granatum]PKI38018.1 hypothetical protein CRG98_041614 [Punica granatum]
MPNPTTPNGHSLNHPSRNSLQLMINQEDDDNKFVSKLLSKESSVANPSFRVYYGGVVGSVPFIWESEPGTPKHTLFTTRHDNLSLPPLTPPPSSFRSTTGTNSDKRLPKKAVRRSGFLHRVLWKMGIVKRSSLIVRSSSSSSLGFVSIKPLDYHHGRRRFASQGSFDSITPFDDYDDEDKHARSVPQAASCFGIGRRNGTGPRGCYGW